MSVYNYFIILTIALTLSFVIFALNQPRQIAQYTGERLSTATAHCMTNALTLSCVRELRDDATLCTYITEEVHDTRVRRWPSRLARDQ